jgi:sugar lactone lactonase YvrE
VLTKDGTAYVTDRDFGNVYKVDIDAGPSLFVADPELEASGVGQNAIIALPDESALLIAIYLPSRLVRVDLKDASVLDVTIQGSFADATFLAGADGMVYADGSLYVAFTSELVKVSPVLADWSSVSAVEVTVPNGMTDVLTTPSGLYLLNGQAVRYALDQAPDPFVLARFVGDL